MHVRTVPVAGAERSRHELRHFVRALHRPADGKASCMVGGSCVRATGRVGGRTTSLLVTVVLRFPDDSPLAEQVGLGGRLAS